MNEFCRRQKTVLQSSFKEEESMKNSWSKSNEVNLLFKIFPSNFLVLYGPEYLQ